MERDDSLRVIDIVMLALHGSFDGDIVIAPFALIVHQGLGKGMLEVYGDS